MAGVYQVGQVVVSHLVMVVGRVVGLDLLVGLVEVGLAGMLIVFVVTLGVVGLNRNEKCNLHFVTNPSSLALIKAYLVLAPVVFDLTIKGAGVGSHDGRSQKQNKAQFHLRSAKKKHSQSINTQFVLLAF